MAKELVTIVLPVYNGMPFLPEAIDSILAQTLKNFRLLIIDDGSTDDSASYLKTVRDSRVVVIHEENQGLGATLNRAIELCETKYIARMDSDDVALPERLEKQLAFMESHPEVVMLGTQLAFLYNGHVVQHGRMPLDHAGIVRRFLKGSSGMGHPTLMCQTNAVKQIGGYRILGPGQDTDFCLRMCELGSAANLAEVLFHYRFHESSIAMRRWAEIRLAYAYGIHCAKKRRQKQPEPNFKEFSNKWHRRALLHKPTDVISSWGKFHYRRYIMNKASGRRKTAIFHFLCAAIVKPKSAFQQSFARLVRLVRQCIFQ